MSDIIRRVTMEGRDFCEIFRAYTYNGKIYPDNHTLSFSQLMGLPFDLVDVKDYRYIWNHDKRLLLEVQLFIWVDPNNSMAMRLFADWLKQAKTKATRPVQVDIM